jgi:hypothetical protein
MRPVVRSYDEAVAILYQASFAAFVAERKRLAGELKEAGDKAGATRLGKVGRPSLSAWAVNQLWWTAQGDFEALFAAAQRLREGDLSAGEARREAISKLREGASTLLAQANQAASDATLRRIATTLAALAAAGSFAPDAPGQLAEDRDPPGFESVGSMAEMVPRAPAAPSPRVPAAPSLRAPSPPPPRELEEARRRREDEARHRREDEEARARADAAERRRLEEERAQRRAERERLERSLRALGSEIERRARDLERMRREVAEAEAELENARSTASQIETRLASLREK